MRAAKAMLCPVLIIFFHLVIGHQVRVENVKDAACHIPVVLERVKQEYIAKTYKVSSWNDPTDFLEQVAQRTGKLLKVRNKHGHRKISCSLMVFVLKSRSKVSGFRLSWVTVLCSWIRHCTLLGKPDEVRGNYS